MQTRSTDPVTDWVAALGALCAGKTPLADARAKAELYVPLLQDKYAPGAFTRDSLAAVAAGCKWFPAYGELCALLTAYWKENRPAPVQPAIAGPSTGKGYWHGFIAARLVAGGDRAHLLSLAKTYASPAELRGIMTAFYPDETPAGPKGQDRAAEYDPEYLRVQVAKLERDPPDAFRTIAVSLLLTMLERHRPDLLAEVGDQLRALITPARPFRTAYQRHSHAAPAAAPQPIREVPLRPEVMLALLDREIAAGRATDATRTRAAALRRQIAANSQPRAAE